MQRVIDWGVDWGVELARVKNKLTAVAVRKAGPGTLEDGGGLRLVKLESGGNWIYRYSFGGRRREMGLGSLSEVSLAEARKERDRWATVLRQGLDPVSERDRMRAEAAAELNREDPTFGELAEMVFEARKARLRGEGQRGRWFSPLATHIIPRIGRRRVSTLAQTDIADALRPIWKSKPATAEKAFQRMRIIFRQGKLMGYECDPFTVEAAGHMLGEVRRKIRHIPATPWQEIPALYARLDRPGASQQCLRWMILTAVRGDAARGARFEEIEGSVWTVPAERMKGLEGKVRDFRVPLSTEAQRVLEGLRERATGPFLFPSYRQGSCITSTAIAKVLNDLNETGRPHGFRTSFRTWVQDNEVATYDVAETALGHVIGSKVERTYARSDLLDQRRVLMEKWGSFVTGRESQVIQLRG